MTVQIFNPCLNMLTIVYIVAMFIQSTVISINDLESVIPAAVVNNFIINILRQKEAVLKLLFIYH